MISGHQQAATPGGAVGGVFVDPGMRSSPHVDVGMVFAQPQQALDGHTGAVFYPSYLVQHGPSHFPHFPTQQAPPIIHNGQRPSSNKPHQELHQIVPAGSGFGGTLSPSPSSSPAPSSAISVAGNAQAAWFGAIEMSQTPTVQQGHDTLWNAVMQAKQYQQTAAELSKQVESLKLELSKERAKSPRRPPTHGSLAYNEEVEREASKIASEIATKYKNMINYARSELSDEALEKAREALPHRALQLEQLIVTERARKNQLIGDVQTLGLLLEERRFSYARELEHERLRIQKAEQELQHKVYDQLSAEVCALGEELSGLQEEHGLICAEVHDLQFALFTVHRDIQERSVNIHSITANIGSTLEELTRESDELSSMENMRQPAVEYAQKEGEYHVKILKEAVGCDIEEATQTVEAIKLDILQQRSKRQEAEMVHETLKSQLQNLNEKYEQQIMAFASSKIEEMRAYIADCDTQLSSLRAKGEAALSGAPSRNSSFKSTLGWATLGGTKSVGGGLGPRTDASPTVAPEEGRTTTTA